ncbi:U3 small nucleolar RNA-associated protein 15 homolog [Neocloeon triangulifer]|uniref:U3 small nucleolar RNA-associated protein 15 homolog n=1 Tax=Neocloeon triangulifer TaxID=2078957 RepID=UPI00286F1B03|nr:U3 small nucleolar RNA-associated protein 15 homolog [Neocloeon triangulifer]
MGNFKQLNTKIFTKSSPELSDEAIYWKKFSAPAILKEFGPIDNIDVSTVEPHYLAVTCSVRVQVYNSVTKTVYKNFTRFKETAYGGKFRQDGKLLCAGGHEGEVKLFDVGSKNLLRICKGHEGPVHRCYFCINNSQLFSCSDDKSVAVWDIASEKMVNQYKDHTDYVRAGCVSPISADIIVSGGYDNRVMMYDTRTNDVAFTLNHGAPVESVIFNKTGSIIISAGGTDICFWDALAGGKLLSRITPHHKTVTCLAMASDGLRLLSGGLDKRVRITDMTDLQPVHVLEYPSPILTIGVEANDKVLAVGMVDGLVSIARKLEESSAPKAQRVRMTLRDWRKSEGLKRPSKIETPEEGDSTFTETKRTEIANVERHLRSYRYSKALDVAIVPYNINKKPECVVSLLQELIRRKGLAAALAGREEHNVAQILKFVSKNIGNFEYMPTLTDVTNTLIDVYGEEIFNMPMALDACTQLLEILNGEEQFTLKLLELQGAMEMLKIASDSHKSMPAVETKILT